MLHVYIKPILRTLFAVDLRVLIIAVSIIGHKLIYSHVLSLLRLLQHGHHAAQLFARFQDLAEVAIWKWWWHFVQCSRDFRTKLFSPCCSTQIQLTGYRQHHFAIWHLTFGNLVFCWIEFSIECIYYAVYMLYIVCDCEINFEMKIVLPCSKSEFHLLSKVQRFEIIEAQSQKVRRRRRIYWNLKQKQNTLMEIFDSIFEKVKFNFGSVGIHVDFQWLWGSRK